MSERGRPPATVSGPVLKALAELRYATAPQIKAHIGQAVTVKQVERALHNAGKKKLVRNGGLVRIKGVKGGATHSTFWLSCNEPPEEFVIAEQEREDAELFKPNRHDCNVKRPMYPSVWHYGQGVSINARRTT